MYHILIYKGGVKDVELMHENITECVMRLGDGSLEITYETRKRPDTWEAIRKAAEVKSRRALWINREGRSADEYYRLMMHFGMQMVEG